MSLLMGKHVTYLCQYARIYVNMQRIYVNVRNNYSHKQQIEIDM